MSRLAHNNMGFQWKTAGKNFTAACHHKVKKGQRYLVFTDYFAYNRIHSSSCVECSKVQSGVREGCRGSTSA